MHLLNPDAPLMPAPKQRKEITLDPKVLDGYVGRYELAPTFIITVTREGQHLMIQPTSQPKIEAFAESPREFFLKAVDAQITFKTDESGRATELVLHQNGANRTARRIE